MRFRPVVKLKGQPLRDALYRSPLAVISEGSD
jgi:hypothetical protein